MTKDSLLTKIPRFRFRFFWQLFIAFILVTILVGVGMFLAGQVALRRMGGNPLVVTHLWVNRLASHYDRQGNWEGTEAIIAGYPCDPAWGPWDHEWQMSYVLAAPDGTIVSTSEAGRLGRTLSHWERMYAIPIVVDGQRVGLLLVSPFEGPRSGQPFAFARALQGFLVAGLLIGSGALSVGLILSRGMSRPLAKLTAATRTVTEGDLSVRVPTGYPGEVGELAAAFNRMAEELARADELRRNMTTDIAHELRTPLSVIRGKLEGILDGVYPATPGHLGPILEETELLGHLVEDLRLLAMAEGGQLTLEKRAMDIGDLLRDAHVNFGPQAADRGVTLAIDLPPDLPQVMADGRRIAQVLGNLLSNALRHTPEGGCVTLSAAVASPLAGPVEVSVTDTGLGIPPEDLPYLFERFWRGDKSRSRARANGGSGLGLAIARQFVEMHGGTIGVESRPSEGTKFWFTLPTSCP